MNITLDQKNHEQIEAALWSAVSKLTAFHEASVHVETNEGKCGETNCDVAAVIAQCRQAISTICIARWPGPTYPGPTVTTSNAPNRVESHVCTITGGDIRTREITVQLPSGTTMSFTLGDTAFFSTHIRP